MNAKANPKKQSAFAARISGITKNFPEAGVLLVLIVLVCLFSIIANNFLTANNLINIARQITEVSIAAIGKISGLNTDQNQKFLLRLDRQDANIQISLRMFVIRSVLYRI